MQRMLDAAFEPNTVSGFESLRQITGASAWAAYVPGWGAPYHATSAAEVREAVASGCSILPILVPTQQSVEGGALSVADLQVGAAFAADFMASCGLSGKSIAIDIEAGWYRNDPSNAILTACNFQVACAHSGYSAIIYCSPSMATGMAGAPSAIRPESVWVASWVSNEPASTEGIPGLPSGYYTAPGQRGWQWSGGHSIGGYNIDQSVIDFGELWTTTPASAPTPTPVTVTPVTVTPVPTPTTVTSADPSPTPSSTPQATQTLIHDRNQAPIASNVLSQLIAALGSVVSAMSRWLAS